MEIALYVLAALGVLAIVVFLVLFVRFLMDLDAEIQSAKGYQKFLERRLESTSDSYHRIVEHIEKLESQLEEVTDIVAYDIAKSIPAKRASRKK
jgi:predicted  nucleic acid-binding Zn-ribbon protein